MKKMVKIMAIALLLGLTGSDAYGMRRDREDGQREESAKKNHIELNEIGEDGLTRLQRAARDGNLEEVEELLESGANPDSTGILGSTPLHMATLEGHADVVEKLLKVDAKPNKIDFYGRIPLYLAVEKGHSDVVKILIQADDNKNKADSNVFFRVAIAHEHANVVEILIRAGANVPEDLRDNEMVKAIQSRILAERALLRAKASAFVRGLHERLGAESPVQMLQGFPWITEFICNPDRTELL